MLQLLLDGQTAINTKLDKLEQLATKTAVIQENEIAGKIQLIYENQMDIIESSKQFATHENRIDALETDVFALKYAFKALKQG